MEDIANQIMAFLAESSILVKVVIANIAYLGLNLAGWIHGTWQRRLTIIMLAVDVYLLFNLISYGH